MGVYNDAEALSVIPVCYHSKQPPHTLCLRENQVMNILQLSQSEGNTQPILASMSVYPQDILGSGEALLARWSRRHLRCPGH